MLTLAEHGDKRVMLRWMRIRRKMYPFLVGTENGQKARLQMDQSAVAGGKGKTIMPLVTGL